MSTPTIVVDEKTGEEKERLINKGRWKGYGPTSVSFSEKGVGASSYSSSAAPRISNAVKGPHQTPTKRRRSAQPVRPDPRSAAGRGEITHAWVISSF